ncbi:MAG TPA: hypothetical protein VLB76_15830 [Thermoanaerobaculia bacterium]|jgi:hypothetical protein|nr:hypothetical protein [Thermoanaerobaculia bacterium]
MSFRKKSFAFPVQLTLAVGVLVLLLGADTAGAQIRTVLVSPVPGDPVASGTGLVRSGSWVPVKKDTKT